MYILGKGRGLSTSRLCSTPVQAPGNTTANTVLVHRNTCSVTAQVHTLNWCTQSRCSTDPWANLVPQIRAKYSLQWKKGEKDHKSVHKAGTGSSTATLLKQMYIAAHLLQHK